MSAPDGGPAFPCGPFGDTMRGEDGRVWHQHDRMPGMTMRDWFAGQALDGYLSGRNGGVVSIYYDTVAEACYAYADAMLRAREAKP